MSRDKRDAERTARRAKRLAERAEERAHRKEQQAERAERRADRLAEQVDRRPTRDKDLDQSIEDIVDHVTQKAEAWIDEKTQSLFEPDNKNEIRRATNQAERARRDAEKARQSANRAGQAADDLSKVESGFGAGANAFDNSNEEDDESMRPRQPRRGGHNKSRRGGGFAWGSELRSSGTWERAKRRRTAHLYRDRQRKKLFGVCAGVADYFGRPPLEMRFYAVMGLLFVPSVMIPIYFITYFLMEDKPLYRRVTDRFEETMVSDADSGRDSRVRSNGKRMKSVRGAGASEDGRLNNVQAMRSAREKFSDIEQRLRQMESHVTSSRFELQREFKKISGED
ncbi:MAG: phage shock protein C [Candidatus Azotimanducaceae bacterium]